MTGSRGVIPSEERNLLVADKRQSGREQRKGGNEDFKRDKAENNKQQTQIIIN